MRDASAGFFKSGFEGVVVIQEVMEGGVGVFWANEAGARVRLLDDWALDSYSRKRFICLVNDAR